MKIESVDFFYLKMPVIRDIGDGSQDALVVRVRSGDLTGWGECEASPLVSIANAVCPPSHSACRNIVEQVLGVEINTPEDIAVLHQGVRARGMDIAQTAHTFSGVEIALWDLLGKKREEPVFQLLGYDTAYPKTPYASLLFAETPDKTYQAARKVHSQGFRAVKFGWGSYGRGTAENDRDQVHAAREGFGLDGTLLGDAGTVWGEDVEAARQRLAALEEVRVTWLEEPFIGNALHAYQQLKGYCKTIKLAAGEGSQDVFSARHLIDVGGIEFIQIDAGRVGGIAPAKIIADYALAKNVTFVNHTFTTHLALVASITPFVGVHSAEICEYPFESTELAKSLVVDPVAPTNGQLALPEGPGLGVDLDLGTISEFLVDVEIKFEGRVLYRTPVV